MPRVW